MEEEEEEVIEGKERKEKEKEEEELPEEESFSVLVGEEKERRGWRLWRRKGRAAGRLKRWLDPPIFGFDSDEEDELEPLEDHDEHEGSVLRERQQATPPGKLKEPQQPLEAKVFAGGPRKVFSLTFGLVQIVLDFAQLYGLLWMAVRAWGWPSYWLKLSSVSLLFNLDVASFVQFWSDLNPIQADDMLVVYLVLWVASITLAVPCVLVAARSRLQHHKCKAKIIAWRYWILRWTDWMTLPLGLVMVRAFSCEPTLLQPRSSFAVHASGCPSSGGRAVAVLAGLVALGLLTAFVKSVARNVSSCVVTADADRHEAFLERVEVEYLLKLNAEWFVDHFRLMSAYRRHSSFFRTEMALRKLAILFGLQLLRFSFPAQALFVSLTSFPFAVRAVLWPPFRSRACSVALAVLEWVFFCNSYIGTLSALQVKSGIIIASTLTPALIAMHALSLIVVAVLVPGLAVLGKGPLTRGAFEKNHIDTIRQLVCDGQSRSWIELIHDTKRLLRQHAFTPDELYPVHLLVDQAQRLQQAWEQAKATSNPLHKLLHVTLEEVFAVFQVKESKSLFPNHKLEAALPRFVDIVRTRERETILMNPTKRKVLRKLNTFSLWFGEDQHPKFALGADMLRLEESRLVQRVNDVLDSRDSHASQDLSLLQRIRHRLASPPPLSTPRDQAAELEAQRAISRIDHVMLRAVSLVDDHNDNHKQQQQQQQQQQKIKEA